MTLAARAHAVVLTLVAVLLIAGRARAQDPAEAGGGGALVSEDVFIAGGAPLDDFYTLIAVAMEGGTVFAAGSGPYHDGPVIHPYLIIRAYDAKTLTLLWQTGPIGRDEGLAAFGVDDGRIFAAGAGIYGHCCPTFLVRAYDGATGSVLWEERLGQCVPGACPDPASAADLAADGGRVVISGCHGLSSLSACFLRAYDGATGTLLWENTLAAPLPWFGRDILTRDGRLFALTEVVDSASGTATYTLHAYDVASGSLLWENPLPGSSRPALAIDQNRVFAANAAHVQAYDPATGELFWDVPSASGPIQMTANGELLFAVGDSAAVTPGLVRTYDAATGMLLWQDQQPNVLLNAVAADGDQVFAAGSYASGKWYPNQSSFFLVRSYDASSGGLLWDNREASPTPRAIEDAANSVAAARGRVVAGGIQRLYAASPTEEWHIRAYHAERAVAPAFSPADGTYETPQSVTLSDATGGATIYYTTDGSMPTTASTAYTAPISVTQTSTINAIASAPGFAPSTVTTATYNLQAAPPTFSPSGGSYLLPQFVSISDGSPDVTIYYTTDGSTPTTSSAQYAGPVLVLLPATIEAMAVAAGWSQSSVASATYRTLTLRPVTPGAGLLGAW